MTKTPTSATSAPAPCTFASLGVPAPLVSALRRQDRTEPFPIQASTLPAALDGRDVLGRARTGSGKTIAFAVPVAARLAAGSATRRPGRPRALILVPTRELANQVDATLQPLAAAMGLRSMTIFGGVGQGPQVAALRRGVDICVATPGRLEDLIGQRHLSLGSIEVTVLDEADHMADLGFLPAVRRLLDQTPRGTQRLLFSATLDGQVDVLVRRYMTDVVVHHVDEPRSAVPEMSHRLLTVNAQDKSAVVHELLAGEPRTLAFTRTKHAARKLAQRLTAAGIPSADLHGNLSQPARTRNLAAFHDGSVRVLVATDIAARGIHVDDVGLVVHVDPPAEHKAYLHRSGRTARAGNAGSVVTVATLEQRSAVRSLLRSAQVSAVEEHRGSDPAPPGAEAARPGPEMRAPGNRRSSGGQRRRRSTR